MIRSGDVNSHLLLHHTGPDHLTDSFMHIPRHPSSALMGNVLRGLLASSSLLAPVSAIAADAVEEQIQRLQDGVLPPVLVQGEPAPKTTLADRMAALHVPGVSIAVIHAGKIEWARGFGVTRLGGPPVTPHTLFQAASISKPITALAVLRLVEMGKLDLDADLNRYLKSWKIPSNSFTDGHPVTLRELLTHTAGMTVHGFPGYASDSPLPTLIQILNGQPPANSPAIRVDATPGKSWRYSGGGYVVIQQLLEDVTGKPFDQLMQETVLDPIGMSDSTYEQPLPPSRLAAVAMPYRSSGTPVKGGPHVYPERAPAGLWTTPSDLARYAIEVQGALSGSSHHVLSAEMARAMLTPGMNQQGLGPHVGGSTTQHYFDHGGANEGYRCNLVAYDKGDGAAVMTNSDNGGPLTGEILRTIAHEYHWPDFQPPTRTIAKTDPKTFDSLAGSYEMHPHVTLTFWREGVRFISQMTGQGKVEVFPQSEREYFAKVVDARISFEMKDQGRASSMILHQNGQDTPGKRLDDVAASEIKKELDAINARVKAQTPVSGSEVALRELLQGVAAGKPDYTRMSPELAKATREQLPQLQKTFTDLGALSGVTFKEVSPSGADVYRVTWKQGAGDIGITLSPDGLVDIALFQLDGP